MSRRLGLTSAPAVALLAVVATAAWSCGGQPESTTAPVTRLSDADESDTVTSSEKGKITVCHKGNELTVSTSALAGHLGHGDRLGSCAADCPCFTADGLADVAVQCDVAPLASCPQQYSLSLFCAPGGGGGTISSLGLFEARLGTNTCSTTTQDPLTGNPVTTTIDVTPAEYEACHQAIVTSPSYPASCPQ